MSRGLLLGITLALGLGSLPHHLSKVIGFSTVLRESSNLSTLEVEEAISLAVLQCGRLTRLTEVEAHRQGPKRQ
jgi:hypothetical protein